MKDSQERYLERKGHKKVKNQNECVIPMEHNEDFFSVHPRYPNFALTKRKLLKDTRGALGRTLERHFLVDDELLTYYNKDKDSSFKKHASLYEAKVCT